MELLKSRIAREGRALDHDVLLVDSFLNHQIDMALMREIGRAFAARFADCGMDRVVTIESSGIAPAAMTALEMGLPLVVLKKRASRITDSEIYQTTVHSFTKNEQYELTCAKRFLPAGERLLFIDDFLAMGEAALGVSKLARAAGCALSGVGIVIEKSFLPGRERLEKEGLDVFSLARVRAMAPGHIEFIEP